MNPVEMFKEPCSPRRSNTVGSGIRDRRIWRAAETVRQIRRKKKPSNTSVIGAERRSLLCAQCKKDSSAFATNQSNNLELWHCRLGHLNYRDLVEGTRKGVIQGIKLKPLDHKYDLICDICCQGKLTRQPFPKKSDRETALLEIIHTDVCGPMRVESLSRTKCFVEFVDDYSRYSTVYFVRTKGEVLEKAKILINHVTNFRNRNVKCIQSDNGTEYTSSRFEDFLKERGISQRLTSPYFPEQNGVSERRNGTLLDMERCLMMQTELPSQVWAEAYTANYISNRCPTRSLNDRTPYEIWYGKPPNVSYFREFGCTVFCLNRDPAKGKFVPRGKEGKFLGYSEQTKGFRVYLPDERKVIITRDVNFIEESSIISEQLNDFAPEELVESPENRKEVIYFPVINNPISEVDSDENNPEIVAMKRGPGRPTMEKSGSRGRPRKVYNMIPQNHEATFAEEAEQAFLAEIPMNIALNGPDAEMWYNAMADEIASMIKNETWKLVNRPIKDSVIGSRIVLRNKFKPDGTLERRMARFVAQGFGQKPGIHFYETFAPVARLSSIRLATALAARLGMKIR
ncbi:hypothetical protein Trydic_g16908 [Trypoxylus dichotomus]